MNGYLAFYNGQQLEVYADTSHQAQQTAVSMFKPPKSKAHMVHVCLAEVGEQPVIQTTSF